MPSTLALKETEVLKNSTDKFIMVVNERLWSLKSLFFSNVMARQKNLYKPRYKFCASGAISITLKQMENDFTNHFLNYSIRKFFEKIGKK